MSFWQSSSAAALITVVLGGVTGQFISCDVQNRMKEREFNDTWLKSRGDQALSSRAEFMKARREAFENIISTAATLVNASEELLYVTTPAFSLAKLRGADRERLRAEQEKLVAAYRQADAAWAPNRFRYDFSVGYFGEHDPKVDAAWSKVRTAVDSHRKCAADEYSKWYMAGQSRRRHAVAEDACKADEAAVSTALQELGAAFALRADYGWRGWDDPKQLKRALNIDR